MANYGYYDAKTRIESGEPYSLQSVATGWRNFAEALRNAAAHTQGTSDQVTAQYGTPYQNFGDRAAPIANWMNGVSTNADSVAGGLSTASSTGSTAQMTMYEEDYRFTQDVNRIVGPQDALSMGRANAIQRREAQAAAVLNGQIDKWSAAYDAFQPGTIAPAPTRAGGGSAAGTGGGSGATTGGGGRAAPVGTFSGGTVTGGGRGTLVGGGTVNGDFPDSSVVGPNGGDFAGWVRDPRTGFLIDPKTGQEFDPVTGRWIDPVTGKPFGTVVQQAARLEGLSGGLTPPGGLLAGGGTGAVGVSPLLNGGGPGGLEGLFGGTLPPSLAAGNPAAGQLRQNAADNMAAKAYAAQQLAQKEASQGGRPYLPPTQAGLAGGPLGRRGPRSRLVTEPETTWTNRAGRTGRGGGPLEEEPLPYQGGRRAGRGGWPVEEEPPLSAGRRGGYAEEPLLGGPGGARGARGGAARGPAGEPFEEGPPAAGGRGNGRSSYLPPVQGGHAGERNGRQRRRPDWLVEDDVWSGDQAAGPAVLGEDD